MCHVVVYRLTNSKSGIVVRQTRLNLRKKQGYEQEGGWNI